MAANQEAEVRAAWKYVVFGMLTLGIYDLICMKGILEKLDTVCGYVERSGEGRAPAYRKFVLLTVFTLGIYGCVCCCRQGERLRQAAGQYGVEIKQRGRDYALWYCPGLLLLFTGPFIALYLLVENLSKVSAAHRYQVTRPTAALAESRAPMEEAEPGEDGKIEQPDEVEVDDTLPTASVLVGTIECIGGNFKGGRITVNPGEELIIGRNPETSQIVLPDRDISRTHCAIRFSRKEKVFYVTDLSTYETTYLNDTIRMKRGQQRPCPLGSKLTLGNGKNQFILK